VSIQSYACKYYHRLLHVDPFGIEFLCLQLPFRFQRPLALIDRGPRRQADPRRPLARTLPPDAPIGRMSICMQVHLQKRAPVHSSHGYHRTTASHRSGPLCCLLSGDQQHQPQLLRSEEWHTRCIRQLRDLAMKVHSKHRYWLRVATQPGQRVTKRPTSAWHPTDSLRP